ncbi:cation diffusion facilitator family transporter [Paraburkholderia sp.]|uniref:cation diffusion facilitator family transporter n=1 Tax=Paraburkholderia sp. TaxID=1926495 RepID=UPI003D6DCF9B
MTTPLQDRTAVAGAASKVLAASIVLNLLLMILQASAGLYVHSSGMLADALHSFVDLVADALVLLACLLDARAAAADPTRRHPRYEPLALLALGLLLGATGIEMTWQAVVRLGANTGGVFDVMTLGVAAFTLASKEMLFRWMAREAKRTRSTLLHANAWHVRADAISSLLVTLAICGSLAGLTRLDDGAAALIGLMIARTGWSFGRRGLNGIRAVRAVQATPDAPTPERALPVPIQIVRHAPEVAALYTMPRRDAAPASVSMPMPRAISVEQEAATLDNRSAA